MQEALLQFIWQYSLYRPDNLRTTTGETVTVVHPGTLNRNAGPDFSAARIRIGSTLLIGDAELHIQTSHWRRHGHQHDAAYDKVILHVVLLNDEPADPRGVAVLELGPSIPPHVLTQYSQLLQTPQPIPCAGQLHRVSDITKESWLNRTLVERWQRRLTDWKSLLAQSNGDWRTFLYWRLAANMGFRINAAPFLQLAQSLPANVVGRHHGNLMQLEALLLGQAGFLEKEFNDDYPRQLKTEYHFLRQKYNLQPIPAHLWKFLRMRPANFPTVRIAQFAALLHNTGDIFTTLLTTDDQAKVRRICEVAASSYWDTHYQLDGTPAKPAIKNLGTSSIEKLLVNTIAPIRFLHAHAQGNMDAAEQALHWLNTLPAEDNSILTQWSNVGWKSTNAAQAQALLEIYETYCTGKRCLDCAIGLSLIRSGPGK